MGNSCQCQCQAIDNDAGSVVVQHPSGKVDKFYWPMTASEVMRMNPGHYVALLISTTVYRRHNNSSSASASTNNHHSSTILSNCPNNSVPVPVPVRLTRIKLLRPTDTLLLGQVYRLITTQEVMKGLSAKKHAKMKKSAHHQDSAQPQPQPQPHTTTLVAVATTSDDSEQQIKMSKNERHRPRSTSSSNSGGRSKACAWQPSLRSISEAAS